MTLRRVRVWSRPGLTGFALHTLRDLDAVTAGLTLHSGGTESAVNHIKKLKRQLCGRDSNYSAR